MKRRRVRMGVEERREQLLAIGARVFAASPYDAVSTEAIADEAGISHGLLFHYFETKHAFYVEVLRRASDELLKRTQSEGAPEERLVAGLDAYFRFVDEHAVAYATLLRGGVGSDPVVREVVESTRAAFLSALGAAVPTTDERITRAALRAWIGFVEALSLDWIDRRDLTRAELVSLAARALAALT